MSDAAADGVGRVLARIDRARLTRLLVEAVNHYSPSYAEEPAMEVFETALRGLGVSVLRQPVPGPSHDAWRANLIVELGPRPTQLLWVGHVDTVAMFDEEDQETRQEGDLLWGLGTADMKSGCAAIVEALAAVLESGLPFKRGLALALVVGEEEYGDGSEALLDQVAAPLTVIGEPTGLAPCIDHYSYYEYRLSAQGTQVHAALPELGANAIHGMLHWLTGILEGAARLADGNGVALNPREIRGGANLFVVAAQCEALLDVHTAPGIGCDPVDSLIQAAQTDTEATHPRCTLTAEQIYRADGYADDPDNPLLAPLRAAYARLGLEWRPQAFRSHSDGALFRSRGALPVICGPGRLEVAHTRDEHVSLDEVEQAAGLYAALIYHACLAP